MGKFLFLYFNLLFVGPILVLSQDSKLIAELIKHHQRLNHWNSCLIVTLGLSSNHIKALVILQLF